MIVEFAGLPGSGKTTLSNAFIQWARPLPQKVLSREKAVALFLRRRNDGPAKNLIKTLPARLWMPFLGPSHALNEFQAASARQLNLISFISRELTRFISDKDLAAAIWNTFIRSFIETDLVLYHKKEAEWVILDEAFCQRCFTLFAYMEKHVETPTIARYAGMILVPGPVFWVDTSPETCIRRLALRFKGRKSPYDLDSNTLLKQFYAGQNILSRLCTFLKERGINVLKLDGESHPDTQIAKIRSVCLEQAPNNETIP